MNRRIVLDISTLVSAALRVGRSLREKFSALIRYKIMLVTMIGELRLPKSAQ